MPASEVDEVEEDDFESFSDTSEVKSDSLDDSFADFDVSVGQTADRLFEKAVAQSKLNDESMGGDSIDEDFIGELIDEALIEEEYLEDEYIDESLIVEEMILEEATEDSSESK